MRFGLVVWLGGVVALGGCSKAESLPEDAEQQVDELASCTWAATQPLSAWLCLSDMELRAEEKELRDLEARIEKKQAEMDRLLDEYNVLLETYRAAGEGERHALEKQLVRKRAELEQLHSCHLRPIGHREPRPDPMAID